MKILHYSLGFPPFARGGLTKYVIDLMAEQKRQGHWVCLLWPGEIRKIGAEPKVLYRKQQNGIESFELINPLPLPLIYGIRVFEEFTRAVAANKYSSFLAQIKPDVIHFHTIMGIHKEFFESVNNLGIKSVFTTHDFFGICPKTTLFFNGSSCLNNQDCLGCYECCRNALGIKKAIVLQSNFYKRIKLNPIVKLIRSSQKELLFTDDSKNNIDITNDNETQKKYISLRKYYFSIFEQIDIIHFNSSYMRDIFANYISLKSYKVISLSHADINDNRKIKNYKQNIVLSYLGAIAEYKGFYMLLEVLDSLYSEGYTNFELNIYNKPKIERPYLKCFEPYPYDKLKLVMDKTDLLIVLNCESFGFTVLEGLSYGVPVLVGQNVGAKDLIIDDVNGLICNYEFSSLKEAIKKVLTNTELIKKWSNNVKEKINIKNLNEHCRELINEFYLQ